LISTIKKVKSGIKSLRFLYHHISLQSLLRYSDIIPGHKGLYSVSNKTNGIKIGL